MKIYLAVLQLYVMREITQLEEYTVGVVCGWRAITIIAAPKCGNI